MKRAVLFAAVLVLAAGGVRAADDAAVAVVKKGIEAHGGEEALKKVKGGEYKVEGEVTVQGEKSKYTGVVSYALPDKFRTSMDTAIGGTKSTQVIVVNGDKVKVTGNGKAVELKAELKGEFLQMAAIQEVILLYPLLDEKKFTLKAEKDEKVDDKEAAVVTATRKGMKDVRLFFDKKTGELVRYTHKMPDPYGQETTAETTNSEFKKFDGVLVPTVHKVKQANKEYMTIKVLDAKLVEKPDLKAYTIE
jgi:outer membrane lipoprotein-sorting protein